MGKQFDREALGRLLNMNDDQLRLVIDRIAAENGLDLSGVNISAGDMASVRRALGSASEDDIRKMSEQIRAGMKRRGNDGKSGKNG
ncbi:MAG: hypothetical protein MJ102_07480 [Clostridia bacterium]|nr:hypothetical protein [Clostridia bacterium]